MEATSTTFEQLTAIAIEFAKQEILKRDVIQKDEVSDLVMSIEVAFVRPLDEEMEALAEETDFFEIINEVLESYKQVIIENQAQGGKLELRTYCKTEELAQKKVWEEAVQYAQKHDNLSVEDDCIRENKGFESSDYDVLFKKGQYSFRHDVTRIHYV